MTIDFIGYAYAATVAAGGIFGYAKAGNIINCFMAFIDASNDSSYREEVIIDSIINFKWGKTVFEISSFFRLYNFN